MRQPPLNRTASQIRPDRASATVPRNVAAQTVEPRNSTNTVGSLAASPARTCVIQLFTRIARWTSRSRKSPPPDVAATVVMMTRSAPTSPPVRKTRRAASFPLPTIVPKNTPSKAIHQKCSLVSTQSACCSDSGYIEAMTRYSGSANQPPRNPNRRRSIGGKSARRVRATNDEIGRGPGGGTPRPRRPPTTFMRRRSRSGGRAPRWGRRWRGARPGCRRRRARRGWRDGARDRARRCRPAG